MAHGVEHDLERADTLGNGSLGYLSRLLAQAAALATCPISFAAMPV